MLNGVSYAAYIASMIVSVLLSVVSPSAYCTTTYIADISIPCSPSVEESVWYTYLVPDDLGGEVSLKFLSLGMSVGGVNTIDWPLFGADDQFAETGVAHQTNKSVFYGICGEQEWANSAEADWVRLDKFKETLVCDAKQSLFLMMAAPNDGNQGRYQRLGMLIVDVEEPEKISDDDKLSDKRMEERIIEKKIRRRSLSPAGAVAGSKAATEVAMGAMNKGYLEKSEKTKAILLKKDTVKKEVDGGAVKLGGLGMPSVKGDHVKHVNVVTRKAYGSNEVVKVFQVPMQKYEISPGEREKKQKDNECMIQ